MQLKSKMNTTMVACDWHRTTWTHSTVSIG